MNPEDEKKKIGRDLDIVTTWTFEVNNFLDYCDRLDNNLPRIIKDIDNLITYIPFAKKRVGEPYTSRKITATQAVTQLINIVGANIRDRDWVNPGFWPNEYSARRTLENIDSIKANPSSLFDYYMGLQAGLFQLKRKGEVTDPHKEHLARANAPEYVTKYFDSPIFPDRTDLINVLNKFGF